MPFTRGYWRLARYSVMFNCLRNVAGRLLEKLPSSLPLVSIHWWNILLRALPRVREQGEGLGFLERPLKSICGSLVCWLMEAFCSHFLKLEVRRRRILHPFSILFASNLYLALSVADPDPGSSAVVTPASVMFHIMRARWQFFGLKILKFLVADPDPGSDVFSTLNPGSGMKKFGPMIRDQHPVYATLLAPGFTIYVHLHWFNLASILSFCF